MPQPRGRQNPTSTITDEQRAEVGRLHGEGKGRNEIATAVGISAGSVTAIVKKLGLSFDRTATAAATAARQADCKALRADLQLGLLEDAQKLRAQLWQPCKVFSFGGRDNSYEERNMDKPPFADQLKIMQAAGAGIDRSLRLAEHDSETGTAETVGILQQTAAALGLTDATDGQP